MSVARAVAAATAVLMATTASAGAETPDFAPGSRIRMKVSGEKKRLVGEVLALDRETLSLRVEDEEIPRVYSREEIVDLDVSAGRRSLGTRALIGGLAGAAAGALAVAATPGSGDDDMFTQGEAMAMVAGFFGACGALTGMLVIPGEKWRGVPLENVRLSLHPVPGRGAGLSLTVTF